MMDLNRSLTPFPEVTLTILGCGTLGKAILRGILSGSTDISRLKSPESSAPPTPPRIPTRFVACVTRSVSAKTLKTELGPFTDSLTVLQNDNVSGTRMADIIILGCKPANFRTILREPGMRDALRGKLLISILAGVSAVQIEEILVEKTLATDGAATSEDNSRSSSPCRVVRVMPNTASSIGESMTVIANPEPPLPADLTAMTTWIFTRIGRVVHLPPYLMDASTALCGSGPAFYALMLEAMSDGAVAMGLPRREAQEMAAQTMKGAAGLVLAGEHPALLRDKVSTPGGCTIGGLLALEEGRVRGNIALAVREATVVASKLGQGAHGGHFLNGPKS